NLHICVEYQIYLSRASEGSAAAPQLRYRPLHQPSAVLWLNHVLPFLPWFSCMATPCLLHQPSGRAAVSVGGTTRGKRWSTASSRCNNRSSSLSRKVSCTWRPPISR